MGILEIKPFRGIIKNVMKIQSIDQIRKKFRREWLLIAVDEMDSTTTTPRRGHLLTHSPRRDEVYEAMLRKKGLTLVTYSDDQLPIGYAAAF